MPTAAEGAGTAPKHKVEVKDAIKELQRHQVESEKKIEALQATVEQLLECNKTLTKTVGELMETVEELGGKKATRLTIVPENESDEEGSVDDETESFYSAITAMSLN